MKTYRKSRSLAVAGDLRSCCPTEAEALAARVERPSSGRTLDPREFRIRRSSAVEVKFPSPDSFASYSGPWEPPGLLGVRPFARWGLASCSLEPEVDPKRSHQDRRSYHLRTHHEVPLSLSQPNTIKKKNNHNRLRNKDTRTYLFTIQINKMFGHTSIDRLIVLEGKEPEPFAKIDANKFTIKPVLLRKFTSRLFLLLIVHNHHLHHLTKPREVCAKICLCHVGWQATQKHFRISTATLRFL